jgi:hypothetical protein
MCAYFLDTNQWHRAVGVAWWPRQSFFGAPWPRVIEACAAPHQSTDQHFARLATFGLYFRETIFVVYMRLRAKWWHYGEN